MLQPEKNPVIERIHTVPGTARVIAKACDITKEAVWKWSRVPAERALTVAEVTGIPLHLVRPDVYPAPRRRTKRTTEAAE